MCIRDRGVSFSSFFLHNRLMNILQRIFTDYYDEIKYTLHPRKTEMETIDKMLGCGDPSFGGAMYAVSYTHILHPNDRCKRFTLV